LTCSGPAAKFIVTDFVNPAGASQPAATNVKVAVERATPLKYAIVMRFVHVVGRIPHVEVLAAAGGAQPILRVVRVKKRFGRSGGAGSEEAGGRDEDGAGGQKSELPPPESEHGVQLK
jgi:hypothetical protein